MRSFLECWSSSLHKRIPRFFFGMIRFIGILLTIFDGEEMAAEPPAPAEISFVISRRIRHLRISNKFLVKNRFLVLTNAFMKSNYVTKTEILAVYDDLIWYKKIFCPNKIKLITLVIPKENLATLLWKLLLQHLGKFQNHPPPFFWNLFCAPDAWNYWISIKCFSNSEIPVLKQIAWSPQSHSNLKINKQSNRNLIILNNSFRQEST